MRLMYRKCALLLILNSWITIGNLSFGQNIDSLKLKVDEIVLSASRINTSTDSLPQSISFIDSPSQINQKASLKDQLSAVPGLFSQNANNFAQDLRISIRGFGARAAFGIRGVRLLIDGVPETTPDGQSQLDNLELNNMKSIEVIRGLSGGLYGNASGGVILINSQAKVKKNFLETDLSYGAFETFQSSIKTGFKFNSSSLICNARYFQSDGYREHAFSKLFSLGASLHSKLAKDWQLRVLLNYTQSPEALDPGGITKEDVETERDQARQRNIDFNSGESIEHAKASFQLQRIGSTSVFKTAVFIHKRDFEGRLPFGFGGYVDLNRNFYGNSTSFEISKSNDRISNKLLIGYDAHHQDDLRIRFINAEGIKGEKTLEQNESFQNLALFLVDHLDSRYFLFSGELRFDYNKIKIEDILISNGENTSDVQFSSLNYGLGVSFKRMKAFLPFVKLSTNFETPTLSELSADPSGMGFNSELKPSSSRSIELGIKANSRSGLSWQSSVFYIRSTNEILPYEIEVFPGRDFFRNAGATQRIGIETYLNYKTARKDFAQLSYTYSSFRFDDYTLNGTELKDNVLPGIPQHLLSLNFGIGLRENLRLYFDNTYTGNLYADNMNNVSVDSYFISNFRVASNLDIQNAHMTIYGGVNNLFDAEYFDNVRINAFGGRHFEAAAGMHGYVGLKLRLEAHKE